MVREPDAKVVRGFSFFGVSFVYVIFEDGTPAASAARPSTDVEAPRSQLQAATST
jgi:copper/silver efflux system protein